MEFIQKEEIYKGWSGDKKYHVVSMEGTHYLLRVADITQLDKKQAEFHIMQKLAALGVPMCKALDFGVSQEGVYALQSWIDGIDAEERIPKLTQSEQYSYGCEAGRILKMIHSISAPQDREGWEDYFNRKMNRKIQKYQQCPIKYENGQAFLNYIHQNRHLLKNRPQTLQHGDYHIGNFMIGNDKQLYVIDFNRFDYGDPWEEFNRIVWCVQKSPLFASGMVNAYFDNKVPLAFWHLLALYIASNTLSSVSWAVPFGQKQIDIMLQQAKEVLLWYDNMQNPIPTWYVENNANEM